MLTLIYTAILMLSPQLVLAHPGDHIDADAAHYLSGAWHLPGLLVLAGSLAGLGMRWRAHVAARRREASHDPR